jgi:hypothetical protein
MTKTPIDDPIARIELVWLLNDGTERPIKAKVGRPYKIDEMIWRCPCELLGVDGKYPDMTGAGSKQALGTALSLIKIRLGHLVNDGEKICCADDRENQIDQAFLDATFGK